MAGYHSVGIGMGCCCRYDVGRPAVLGGGRSGVLRGGFCLVLVGLSRIDGSLADAFLGLSWASVRLWIEQLLRYVSLLHVIGRLYGFHLAIARSGPPVFPLFVWELDLSWSCSCWDGPDCGLPMLGIECPAC